MESKCESCNSKCCRYIVLDIETPEMLSDFENIKWYVSHENVQVFVDCEGFWNLKFITKCKHLTKFNRCNIYKTRPEVCREFSPKTCSENNENENILTFDEIGDVEIYIKDIFSKKRHLVK